MLHATEPSPPLVYTGPTEIAATADGGLQPVVGVQNIQVFRANRTASAHADGLTDTYNHAPMLAYWHGRFYLEYLSGAVNEHDNPTVTSLTNSADGLTWSAPRVIFPAITLPDGTHTIAHQRMGFYVAPDGRLLALSFYGTPPSPNDGKGLGRAVREIHADGSLGNIHFIRLNTDRDFPDFPLPYPLYSASSDPGFVSACEALLTNSEPI
ncbi:six-hairpin glycosidase, partial [bacterium]|nr:six-hairpin glycosidase [bacterium]